jgi:hypothetical protein
VVIGLLVAACGGSGTTPTQDPGGGGTPTQNPGGGTPTQNPGGGGGSTGGGTGTIHLEVGGPLQQSVDLPFFALGSRFGGTAGVALNFTTDGSGSIASITSPGSTTSDTWTISLINDTMNANAAECQLSNWTFGATSASGTFDCKNGFAIKVLGGDYLTGVTMKGNFTASQ